MLSVPDWPSLLETAWSDIAEAWAAGDRGERIRIVVEASRGEATLGRWDAVVDPAGPGDGEPALRAALGRLLPRAGYPFEGAVTIRAGEDEILHERVRVSRAAVPAGVRLARARALKEARRADELKTRQMLEMHQNTPEIVFAAGSAAEGGARVEGGASARAREAGSPRRRCARGDGQGRDGAGGGEPKLREGAAGGSPGRREHAAARR